MNPFSSWTSAQVFEHNARVAAKRKPPTLGAVLKQTFAHSAKRVRQGEPKVNKWEQEWVEQLKEDGWNFIKAQSFRVKLANGSWYKPDASAVNVNCRLHCFEVKGGSRMKGVAKGILALKVAAALYPEIVWTLCWKEHGEWKTQQIIS